MRSSFFEFHVAKTGLFVARGGLEVVAHNTANAITPGFSRQFAEIRANHPMGLNNGRGMVGTGAEVFGIGQFRNAFLDTKFWSERAIMGDFTAKFEQMSMVERLFRALSDTGPTSGLNAFFSTLQDLNTAAGEPTYRTNVIQSALGMTRFINNMAESLQNQQRAINSEVHTVVTRINSLGSQIASLNEQIRRSELDGSRANDLRDARALLIDELSLYVNVEVREIERNADFAAGKFPDPADRNRSNLEFHVLINGQEFVAGSSSRGLKTVARDQDQAVQPLSNGRRNPHDVNGLFDVYFRDGSGLFDIYHPDLRGQLRGLIDARDGNNANFMRGNDVAFDAGAGTLSMAIASGSRMDVITQPTAGSPGEIVIVQANGMRRTLQFTEMTILPDGTAEFALTPQSVTRAGNINWTGSVTAEMGRTSSYKGIPHYMDQLNTLVRTLTKAFNEGLDRNGNPIIGPDGNPIVGHIHGYNAPDDGLPQNLGTLFFTHGSNTDPITDYHLITASNFTINPELLANAWKLAAAVSPTAGVSNNEVIQGFLWMQEFSGMFAEGKIQDFVIAISSELGIDVNQARRFSVSYGEITAHINLQRKSVSGVDLGEETAMMIRWQHLYQSASRLINVIDGIYDTLINRMGV